MPFVRNDNPLHPVVQLKFGDGSNFIATIPPEHLQEFTYVSKLSAGSDVATFTFIDESFGKIEQQLFEIERKAKPLLYRWGYPGNGLEQSYWHRLRIESYLPEISHAGLRITIEGRAPGSEFAALVGTTMYRGKISTVVKAIAKEMGFANKDIFVEETDDDINDTKETPIATGYRTRVDMLNWLVGIARSKSNRNRPYLWGITSEGSFHFHTSGFEGVDDRYLTSKSALKDAKKPGAPERGEKGRVKGFRNFNVLFGTPNGVISFMPRYRARQIGSFAQSVIGGTLDPKTKQHLQYPIDRDTEGMTTKNDPKNAKTTAAPYVQSKDRTKKRSKTNAVVYVPTKQVGTKGRCAGKTTEPYTTPDTAQNSITNAWMRMQQALQGATLELVGLPEFAGLSARERYINIYVILPDASLTAIGSPEPGLHWSSGQYQIIEVRHVITGMYTITVELRRPTAGAGPFAAKTVAPQKKQVSTVSTSNKIKVPVNIKDLDLDTLIKGD